MENVAEKAEDMAAQAKSKMKETADKTSEELADAVEDAADRWERFSDGVRDFCRERPFQSLGIAIAGGAVLGALLSKAFSRSESPAEKGIRKAVRVGEETWRQVRNGLSETAHGLKSAVEAFKR